MNKLFRKITNDLHLWLGLASGIVLFVVCLSGTIYTFHKETNEFFNKEKYNVTAVGQPLAIDSLINKLQTGKTKVTAVTVYDNAEKSWLFTVKNISKKKQEGGKDRGKQILVNPYTGEVLGSTESKANDFFLTMMKLHRWLLMDQKTGRIVVGVATVIFVFMLLSGLILWIPKRIKKWNNWKKGFKIRFSAKWKRINHDLHNTLGFYSFIILLIMALTGLCWSFDWYRDGLSSLLGAKVFGGRGEKPTPSEYVQNAQTISLEDAIAKANGILPGKGNISINLPEDSTGSYVINKSAVGFFALSVPDKVTIDQYSGDILKLDKFADKNLGQKIAGSIKPLHTGDIFGMFSKIIYFIFCLIATSLPVTGTIIWINKMKKK